MSKRSGLYFIVLYFAVFMLLISLFAKKSYAGGKVWSSHVNRGRVLYDTYGTKVQGHRFGFIKEAGDCGTDELFILWSSKESSVMDLNAGRALLEIDVDGVLYNVDADIFSAAELRPGDILISITSLSAEPDLIRHLVRGSRAGVKITGPEALAGSLSILEDTFSLIGFTANRSNAKKLCSSLPQRRLAQKR